MTPKPVRTSNLSAYKQPGTVVYQAKKRSHSNSAANALESMDIEQGLNLGRVQQLPYVKGRKIVRYYSKRTNRSAVVSIIDPNYLLSPHVCANLTRTVH